MPACLSWVRPCQTDLTASFFSVPGFPFFVCLFVLILCMQRGVEHVLVEGGPGVARGFLAEGLVDRAIIVRAPVEFSHPVPSDISTDTLKRLVLLSLFFFVGNAVVCARAHSMVQPPRKRGGFCIRRYLQ